MVRTFHVIVRSHNQLGLRQVNLTRHKRTDQTTEAYTLQQLAAYLRSRTLSYIQTGIKAWQLR